MSTHRWHDDDGSAGVEAALAVVALLLVGCFLIGAMRVTNTGGDVNAAAWSAARAAAANYDPAAAEASARAITESVLADRGVACTDLGISVGGDLTAGGIVTVDVTCTVSLADVVLAGFPGERVVYAHAVEQVDVVRGGG
jgi:Flp pilus assembly protein TadG